MTIKNIILSIFDEKFMPRRRRRTTTTKLLLRPLSIARGQKVGISKQESFQLP